MELNKRTKEAGTYRRLWRAEEERRKLMTLDLEFSEGNDTPNDSNSNSIQDVDSRSLFPGANKIAKNVAKNVVSKELEQIPSVGPVRKAVPMSIEDASEISVAELTSAAMEDDNGSDDESDVGS